MSSIIPGDLNVNGNSILGNFTKFNADGTYSLQGQGSFGVINATNNIYSTQGFIIGSSNASGNTTLGNNTLGIYNRQATLAGIKILNPSSQQSPYSISGNLTFDGPKSSNNGIVFNDGSFLSSSKTFGDIVASGKIQGDTAIFSSIDLSGNINGGLSTFANFNSINCLNNGTFSSITANNIIGSVGSKINIDTGNFKSLNVTGNYMIDNLTTTNIKSNTINGNNLIMSGNIIFNSNGNNIISTKINGDQIKTGSITLSDNSILTRAPGITVSGNIQNIWNVNGNTANASITLNPGTWLVTFNIYFTSTTSANNFVYGSGCGNSNFGLVGLAGTTNSSSTGTYIYTTSISSTINLFCKIPATIDITKSSHIAVRIA